jgi:hypothetical protein
MLGGGSGSATNPLCHTPLSEPNAPVELLHPDGAWVNGWKLQGNSTKHSVIAWRYSSHGIQRKTDLRWGIDVRPSQQQDHATPSTEFDPTAEFPF